MRRFLKFKRLKIAEQILIVLLFAVLIPMAISGFIINNINQQSMRSQLRDSAVLISKMVSEEIDVFYAASGNELNQINLALKSYKTQAQKKRYLKYVIENSPEFEKIELVNNRADVERIRAENHRNHLVAVDSKTSDNKFLVATFNVESIKKKLFQSLMEDRRQIYVLSSEGELVASHNFNEKDFKNTLKYLPKKLKKNEPIIFGGIKNQPFVYFKKDNPQVTIIVNTTKAVTKKAINENRYKIILSVLFASMTVIFVVGLYTYYLYINIRQLFKGIIAITKGNYQRRIRLLTHVFTPYEIVFLAFEFNRMANQIHKSYIQLKKNNAELKKLNEFRSNLIDTVSHEFRTPLTSIQGYTSRLLRQDIQIDEETRQKSLRTIKKQSERLSRMIEDLLVIPDIEGARIRVKLEPVWLNKTINSSISLVKSDEKEIINTVGQDFPLVIADKDRLEQVFVNLLENAVKYADEGSKIFVEATNDEEFANIFIKNDCDFIPREKLQKLFEKFTRIDDKTTRTTRGTGLGLFIVKGLVEAMEGEIRLHSTPETGFTVEIKLPIFKSDEWAGELDNEESN